MTEDPNAIPLSRDPAKALELTREILPEWAPEVAKGYLASRGFIMGLASCEFNLDQMAALCHVIACGSGWYVDVKTNQPKPMNFGERIALCHSELSEALEGDRKSLMSDHIPGFTMVEEELADTLIRIFDLARSKRLHLGEAFTAKCKYNLSREDHKIENRQKETGKAY